MPVTQPIVDADAIVVAHLDEESVPAAENPGTALDTTAPETNPGPSADWEQLPAANTAVPAKAASSANAASSVDAGTSAAAAQSAKSGPAVSANSGASAGGGYRSVDLTMKPAAHPQAQPSAPDATVASVQKTPAADANSAAGGAVTGSAEGQDANPGPSPALDLGAMQSGPDLAAVSLASEIKKAETPARAAALRVTEQARVELAAGKTDDALRDLGRAVSIDPGNPFEYFYLGRVYLARRNYAQALTFLKRAEIGFGARPDWLGETVGFEGACYEELSQTSDAALAYRRALGSAPNNLRARVGYSRLGGDLTSASSADASTAAAPAREAPPPPERAAAEPAPVEAPPPPPPAPQAPENAADYQPD
jgi:tetratricopeptide (TPR) repeat protein